MVCEHMSMNISIVLQPYRDEVLYVSQTNGGNISFCFAGLWILTTNFRWRRFSEQTKSGEASRAISMQPAKTHQTVSFLLSLVAKAYRGTRRTHLNLLTSWTLIYMLTSGQPPAQAILVLFWWIFPEPNLLNVSFKQILRRMKGYNVTLNAL